MSTGTNKQRITQNNGIINDDNADLLALKLRINNLPSTTDATATASEIASGKTAYVNGVKITGTLPTLNANSGLPSNEVSHSTAGLLVLRQTNGDYILKQNSFLTALDNQVAPVIGLTANILKKDEVVLGVTGTYEGTLPWSQIGYEQPPQKLLEEFDYALDIVNEWDPTDTEFEMEFTDDENLVFFPNLDLSNVDVRIRDTFCRCPNFEHFPALYLPKVPGLGYVFVECPKLTDESLNNILLMCINATLCVKTSLQDLGLSATQIAKCKTLSNYSDFIASGWKAERNS